MLHSHCLLTLQFRLGIGNNLISNLLYMLLVILKVIDG